MSDGINYARAFRVGEIMDDFRNLQHYLSQLHFTPMAEEYYLEGYSLLRQCKAEAQQSLQAPFGAANTPPSADPEQERAQLTAIIIDASVRRFRAQRAYLRSHPAQRWMGARNAILRGQKPNATHLAALQQIDNTLRMELLGITDEHVYETLRAQDAARSRWLAEDPPLAQIQQILMLH